MIVNYDKDTGWSNLFDNFTTVPQITEEVKTALSKLPNVNMDVMTSAEKLGEMVGYTSEDFYKFAKSADMSGDLLSQYKVHLEETGQATSKFSSFTKIAGNALKTVGSFAVNALASWAISEAIGLAIKGIYNIVKADEIAIEKVQY